MTVIDNVVTTPVEYEILQQPEFDHQDHQEDVTVEVPAVPVPVASYDTLFPALGAPSAQPFAVPKKTVRIEASVVTQVNILDPNSFKWHFFVLMLLLEQFNHSNLKIHLLKRLQYLKCMM